MYRNPSRDRQLCSARPFVRREAVPGNLKGAELKTYLADAVSIIGICQELRRWTKVVDNIGVVSISRSTTIYAAQVPLCGAAFGRTYVRGRTSQRPSVVDGVSPYRAACMAAKRPMLVKPH
jgi:hypothetical protein